MIVGSRQRLGKIDEEAEIKLGDNKIKKISETKTLGVIVDDQLKWNSHINMVATKVSKGIGMIRRMKALNLYPNQPLFLYTIQLSCPTLTIAALFGI